MQFGQSTGTWLGVVVGAYGRTWTVPGTPVTCKAVHGCLACLGSVWPRACLAVNDAGGLLPACLQLEARGWLWPLLGTRPQAVVGRQGFQPIPAGRPMGFSAGRQEPEAAPGLWAVSAVSLPGPVSLL